MASNTDEHREEFINLGFSNEEAIELAYNYIGENVFQPKQDFISDNFWNNFANIDYINDPDDENNFYEMNLIDLDEPEGRGYNIGCDFEGVKGFEEKDDEYFYIPTSYNCIFKCIEKAYILNKNLFDQYFKDNTIFKIPLKGFTGDNNKINISCFGISLTKFRNVYHSYLKTILKNPSDENCAKLTPEIYKFKKSTLSFELISHDAKKSILNQEILLCHFNNKQYHAVLSKEHLTKNIYKKLKFKIVYNKILGDTQAKLNIKDKISLNYNLVAYDIETFIDRSTKIDPKTGEIFGNSDKLIPYCLGFCDVPIGTKKEKIEKNLLKEKPYILLEIENKNENLMEKFFSHLQTYYKNENPIIVYAHNGSRFDNLYCRSAKNIRILNGIKVGSAFKRIDLEIISCSCTEDCNCFKRKVIFMDTQAFTANSLKNSAKAFKCELSKIDFDIVAWTFDDFVNKKNDEKSWVEYLKFDVLVLKQIIQKIEESLNEYGIHIYDNLGIPSVAWNLMMKTCFNYNNVFIMNDPVTAKFERESIYGGRVLRWKSHYNSDFDSHSNKGLISLDVNSLYPAAMNLYSYPVGTHYIISDDQLNLLNSNNCDFSLLKFNNSIPALHYIVEIEFETPNIRYPIIPYRTKNKSIIYPVGTLKGVYNDVEINEMLKDNYKIKQVFRGVYFTQSEKIFSKLIETLYNDRKKFQAEGSGKEYMLKITLNSMYGILLLLIDKSTYFSFNKNFEGNDKNVSNAFKLRNGQYEITVNNDKVVEQKPAYLGGYVLSYARKIVNQYINKVGRDKIYYSDTDSLYIEKKFINTDILSNNLGGIKNDYGPGKYICEANFIGLKRYLLVFPDGSTKAKFLGINFKTATTKNDFLIYDKIDNGIIPLLDFYRRLEKGEVIEVNQEKWFRSISSAINPIKIDNTLSIIKRDMEGFRGIVDNNVFFPNGFNVNEPEYIIEYDKINKLDDLDNIAISKISEKTYNIVSGFIYSVLPLVSDELISYKLKTPVSNFFINKKSGIIIFKKKNYYKIVSSKYGASDIINISDEEFEDFENLICIDKNHKFALMNPVDINKILSLLKKTNPELNLLYTPIQPIIIDNVPVDILIDF